MDSVISPPVAFWDAFDKSYMYKHICAQLLPALSLRATMQPFFIGNRVFVVVVAGI